MQSLRLMGVGEGAVKLWVKAMLPARWLEHFKAQAFSNR